jgi:hypothetical protein
VSGVCQPGPIALRLPRTKAHPSLGHRASGWERSSRRIGWMGRLLCFAVSHQRSLERAAAVSYRCQWRKIRTQLRGFRLISLERRSRWPRRRTALRWSEPRGRTSLFSWGASDPPKSLTMCTDRPRIAPGASPQSRPSNLRSQLPASLRAIKRPPLTTERLRNGRSVISQHSAIPCIGQLSLANVIIST